MLNAFFSSLTIEEKTTTGGSTGTVAWSDVVGDFTGFIQPIGGGETFRDGKAGEQATHRLYTTVDTPVIYLNRVTQNSQPYLMLYAIQPAGVSGINRHKEIIMGLIE